MSSTVLVTGAAGFIAFHLIQRLLREGYCVVGLDNFDDYYSPVLKKRNIEDLKKIAHKSKSSFNFFELSLAQISSADIANTPIDIVVHLAARAGVRPSVENPHLYTETNILGTLSMLEFCRFKNIGRFIFGSSSSVYGERTPVPFRETSPADLPVSPYGASKRSGELYYSTYSHLFGMRIAALRFFTVYGPRQRPDLAIHKFAKMINQGTPIPFYGNGTTQRDYTFVTDIVEGILGAMSWTDNAPKSSYEIFNLGGAQTCSLTDLVKLVEQAIGKKATLEYFPLQAGDVSRTFADVSKAKQILGFSPKVPLKEGIPLFIDWYLERSSYSATNRE